MREREIKAACLESNPHDLLMAQLRCQFIADDLTAMSYRGLKLLEVSEKNRKMSDSLTTQSIADLEIYLRSAGKSLCSSAVYTASAIELLATRSRDSMCV